MIGLRFLYFLAHSVPPHRLSGHSLAGAQVGAVDNERPITILPWSSEMKNRKLIFQTCLKITMQIVYLLFSLFSIGQTRLAVPLHVLRNITEDAHDMLSLKLTSEYETVGFLPMP